MEQSTNWQSSLRQALLQDPKKTSVMGALLLLLAIVGGRQLMSGNAHPPLAAGSIAMQIHPVAPITVPVVLRADGALRAWLSAPTPKLSRNDFFIRPDDFPADPAHPRDGLSDGAFWKDVEKSLSVQADQQEQRQSAIASLKTQAESIRPASTMMGIHPRAMVNGSLVAEGDTISGFCLLKIEPRGIIVSRDGVKLAVPLR